ncbi:MAG: methyltransferase [Candidatus Melainabacteria bacterium HGW-Melainabacteria-1]|nr:MAG: methyltransferase [Candidatus Melainabacteria bacterium HGW-Melainabacteria-1]
MVNLIPSPCLACGFHGAMPLFDGGLQPLATLGWPDNAESSLQMERLRLDFIRCLRCGHIYNQAFEYQQVPYVKHPNLMYNQASLWQAHQQAICQRLAAALPEDPVVIEIGCGSGGFLKQLAQHVGCGQFIGFDPNSGTSLDSDRVSLRPELFVPAKHLAAYQPDLILSRHVLEHLINPLAFIQELAFASSLLGQQPSLFFEVPCVDRVLAFGRLEDLYYEHNSHFTSHSFKAMLQSLDCRVESIETGYNQEVIFGLIKLEPMPLARQIVAETENFSQLARAARQHIPIQIRSLLTAGKRLALWGGTGKGAAFVHHFGLDLPHIPMLVVDSDPDKVGSYVPGSQYRISPRQLLLEEPVDTILIPAQWRAQDIVLEIQAAGIPYQQLLLEHQGQLVDFFNAEHPYRQIFGHALD